MANSNLSLTETQAFAVDSDDLFEESKFGADPLRNRETSSAVVACMICPLATCDDDLKER